jgi:hypothetical protein
MEHNEVVEKVKIWLQEKHPSPTKVEEKKTLKIDLAVYTEYGGEQPLIKYHLQVECKNTTDYVGQAVGMCLQYYAEMDGLFTYLAIPEDFKRIQELQNIFKMIDLPIGLIVVHRSREPEIIKKAEGNEITRTS